ncbi:MAG: response regulator transcription factor [Nitrospirota bacterium]|nr:response regulator transcription factor [Nitrospirota bacterium]
MIDLIIADDHAIFRHGLKNLLAQEPDFRILAEADNGQKALQDIRDLRPHVAVLDLSMPCMNGIEVVAEVRRNKLATRCILLTVHDDAEIAATAIQTGTAGYLLKNHTFQEINQAIRTVAGGRNYLSPELITLLADQTRLAQASQRLTRREQEVLRLVAQGLSAKEIASKLVISERTVDTHKTHIMSKLDIHSTPALISYALRNKLVTSG